MRGHSNRGFTLVELLVAMGVFIVVIMIAGQSFNAILSQAGKVFRSEESNFEGVIGLEMFRHDLQQAGLGLFTEPPPVGYTYLEADVAPAVAYNDAASHVPRPLVFGNNLDAGAIGQVAGDDTRTYNVVNGTDYLVIKATTVGNDKASQKWTYLKKEGTTISLHTWPSNAENFETANTQERLVLLKRTFSNPPRTTIEPNTADNTLWFKRNSPAFDNYTSQGDGIFTVYGFYKFPGTQDENKVRFPFNRADYFVARPATMPGMCAPNTGVLYKATVNHADGKLKYNPILDCVADMQVVLGWDLDLDGNVETWSNADGSVTSPASTAVATALSQAANDATSTATPNIRNSLKVVKIYLIVQNGGRDLSYTSPTTIPIGDVGEMSLIRPGDGPTAVYTLANTMLNYRWKEYRLVVRPKNLTSNQ